MIELILAWIGGIVVGSVLLFAIGVSVEFLTGYPGKAFKK
jgi:hypothetical protein